jgi:hypothetical protein
MNYDRASIRRDFIVAPFLLSYSASSDTSAQHTSLMCHLVVTGKEERSLSIT